MLGGVDHRHEYRPLDELRELHGDAVERVEGVALFVAPGTGERGTELGLEHGLHEGVVASDVVGKGLGSDYLVRATVGVL